MMTEGFYGKELESQHYIYLPLMRNCRNPHSIALCIFGAEVDCGSMSGLLRALSCAS